VSPECHICGRPMIDELQFAVWVLIITVGLVVPIIASGSLVWLALRVWRAVAREWRS